MVVDSETGETPLTISAPSTDSDDDSVVFWLVYRMLLVLEFPPPKEEFRGAAGVGRTDSKTIASWLLKFASYRQRLRNATAGLAKWLSNDYPPSFDGWWSHCT